MKPDRNMVHAWKDDDGKYRLGRLHKKGPANIYDDKSKVVAEADRRGLTIEWHDDAV